MERQEAMKSQNDRQVSPAMVEDKETEKRKKRDLDAGLIVIANDGNASKPKAAKKGRQKQRMKGAA
jgi:hypothetical protein